MYMTENVPMMDIGSTALGMIVADTLRRNTKMTSTTSTTATSSEICTSRTDSRIASDRSYTTSTLTAAGICARSAGRSLRIPSTTPTVFVPGWRWTASTTARVFLNQLATLSSCTLSMTLPSSSRRTGAPLRYVTISGRYAFASVSLPVVSRVHARLGPCRAPVGMFGFA
jgi:hypothetical protein